MYGQKRSRVIDIAVVISTVVHIGFIFLAGRARSSSDYAPDLHEVTFMDVTYRPEVAKVMSRAAAPGGPGPVIPDAPTYAPTYAPEIAPALDLSATMERDHSQAKIDLDGFELDRSGGMDVIRLGGEGSGKSTDEILAQPKVTLSGSLDRSGAAGLRGHPGVRPPEAQLQIEHRPLAQAPARELPKMAVQDLPQVAAAPTTGSNFMVAGPISQRPITKRVRPRYPKWALDRRISGTVVVRIWVAPNGTVKGAPTVESSSGYPDLDQVVIAALRGWEFEPLGAGVKTEDQWGVITFRFTLS
ncbi:MAG TPA: energy transducer TonB [candidate division WOR-3 bacterium]|uniref:Energy transducer TonB n=1 Tax=candidate division WOR-3 bacterium TaxID=2052148 RepID=A0A7V0T5U2_UNCW3|nr:energy transducer TonB [candidate division WOR-3 bacterium]